MFVCVGGRYLPRCYAGGLGAELEEGSYSGQGCPPGVVKTANIFALHCQRTFGGKRRAYQCWL